MENLPLEHNDIDCSVVYELYQVKRVFILRGNLRMMGETCFRPMVSALKRDSNVYH